MANFYLNELADNLVSQAMREARVKGN